jgi:AcrR family transcriptional regulator
MRQRIVDTAEALFAERGFAGLAMRDLAAAVGLNAASLYNYFASKQALYETVLEQGVRPLIEVLDALEPSDWAPQRLDAATDAILAHLSSRPHLPRLLLHEAVSGGEHLPGLAANSLRPLFERALLTFEETRARGDRRVLQAWQDDELPLLLMAFHHVVLGHFAVASMLREVLGDDPFSQESIERQRRFVRKLVRLLVAGTLSPDPRRPGRSEGAGAAPPAEA